MYMYTYVIVVLLLFTQANSTTLYIIIGYGIQFKSTTHVYDFIIINILLLLYVLLYM